MGLNPDPDLASRKNCLQDCEGGPLGCAQVIMLITVALRSLVIQVKMLIIISKILEVENVNF